MARKLNTRLLIVLALVLILVIVAIILAVVFTKKDKDETKKAKSTAAKQFSKAAVAADSLICSRVGTQILKDNGNAVDAAVATQFCTGVVDIHSTGIGGGGFMLVYKRSTQTAEIFDYREVAPAKANASMYKAPGASSVVGGLSIAVPGETYGLRKVWEKHGKLSWPKLIEPAMKLARDGFPLPIPVHESIVIDEAKIRKSPGLMKLLFKNGRFVRAGETIKNSELATTLQRLQTHPYDLYNGTLSHQVVRDITDAGGIITAQDLKDYKMKERVPTTNPIGDLKMFSMPPPGSGAVLAMILNIIKAFNLRPEDNVGTSNQVKTIHKIMEAYKWAYARRALLGDPDFIDKKNLTEALNQMLNHTVAEMIRKNKIWMNATHKTSYYGGYYGKDDFGTTHVSVLAENGDAVATTDTINYRFGSMVRSETTGIIFNDEMDDFATPGVINVFGYPATANNYIVPGKRPLSSMSPTVIIDKNGDVKMIAGASGGSRIITGIAQTLIRKLFLGKELGAAVEDPRAHHQLLPDKIQIEKKRPLAMEIQDGLKKLGHEILSSNAYCVVQAIYREKSNQIFAKSDTRKHGEADGF